jgi:hypothetical protein
MLIGSQQANVIGRVAGAGLGGVPEGIIVELVPSRG